MSSPKRKPKNDYRRTLTPNGARIVVDASGFSVLSENETIADVRWSQVKRVLAYTRFIKGQSRHLCLAFELPPPSRGKEDQVVVHSEVPGWQFLTSALTDAFTSIDSEWVKKASSNANASEEAILFSHVASFTANPVQVWPAHDSMA
jgi:hypothetical protein